MSSLSNLYNKITLTPMRTDINSDISKTYRGFSTISEDTENFKLYDFQLIQRDILNHFYTRQGERLMNPTFGTIIWDLLFEPLTEELKYMITQNVNEIINYDPRVSADQVVVTSYDNGIQLECVLTFIPYNVSQSMILRFDRSNGLLSQ